MALEDDRYIGQLASNAGVAALNWNASQRTECAVGVGGVDPPDGTVTKPRELLGIILVGKRLMVRTTRPPSDTYLS